MNPYIARLGVDSGQMMVAELGHAYRGNHPGYTDMQSLDAYRENDGTGLIFRMETNGGRKVAARAYTSNEGRWGERIAGIVIEPAWSSEGDETIMLFEPGWFQLGDPCYDMDDSEDGDYFSMLDDKRAEQKVTGTYPRIYQNADWKIFVTETGWGDGEYVTHIERDPRTGNIVEVKIIFIDDEPECDECGERGCDGECMDCYECGESYCDGTCQDCPDCGGNIEFGDCECYYCMNCGETVEDAGGLCYGCQDEEDQ